MESRRFFFSVAHLNIPDTDQPGNPLMTLVLVGKKHLGVGGFFSTKIEDKSQVPGMYIFPLINGIFRDPQ